MILGVAIENGHLLLAAYSRSNEAQYSSLPLEKDMLEGRNPESAWEKIEAARELQRYAEKVVFAIPASRSFLKCLNVGNKIYNEDPQYKEWAAKIHLPGDIAKFRYGFLSLQQSYDLKSIEVLLFAYPALYGERIDALLAGSGPHCPLEFVPEQVGLARVLEKSLSREEHNQAGLVYCTDKGIVAVYIQNGRYVHSRMFPINAERKDETSTDVETYFLSRADSSETFPLVITGYTGCFTTNWSPVVPAFLEIHDLEFASAWGVADLAANTP
jgi:hypothetical protein